MKLYLSSIGVPDTKAFLSLLDKQPKTVAIIPTAWNIASDDKSDPYIVATTTTFEGLGFTHETVNLEDYQDKPAKLKAKLQGFSVIWLLGGNTFYLNYWMRESGFDTIIHDLLADGLIYGGESAGAVVAGKTLHGIELLDDPNDAPEVIWKGLSLVDYGIIPHWQHARYAGRIEQTYNEMQLFGPVKTLTNAQNILTF